MTIPNIEKIFLVIDLFGFICVVLFFIATLDKYLQITFSQQKKAEQSFRKIKMI